MSDLIIEAITRGLKLVHKTREALAADLREIADKVENGALIPDEAFSKAVSTQAATKVAYDNLPD